jgi:hypothetical protein
MPWNANKHNQNGKINVFFSAGGCKRIYATLAQENQRKLLRLHAEKWRIGLLGVLVRLVITLCEWRRDWDTAIWPHATAGFFKVKQNIPRILEKALSA